MIEGLDINMDQFYLPPASTTQIPSAESFGGDLFFPQEAAPTMTADNWYVDADSSGDSWSDDIWDWAGSEQGISVLGGALGGVASLWASEKDAENYLKAHGGGGGPSAAELQDARIAKHNESINKPMDMGARKFKK